MGATIQKRKHSYRIAIHLGGKRAYQSVKTLAEAKLLLREVQKAEINGVDVITAIEQARTVQPKAEFPTLQDAMTAFLDSPRAGLRYSSAATYRQRLQRWVYPTLGPKPVNTIRREDIGAILTGVTDQGLSRSSVDQIRNPLVRMFEDLVEEKVLAQNPASNLRRYLGKITPKTQRAPKFFTPAEASLILRAARATAPAWATFIQTGLQAGLRYGEISALQVSDIDWKKARIHVQRTQSTGGRIEPPKTAKGNRYVKASPTLLAALRAQCESVALEGQVKAWPLDARALVFPNNKGHIRRYSNFLLIWTALLKTTRQRYRPFHATRHSYATTLLENGADLRWTRDQMGHASVKMTADTYAHATPDAHEHAVKHLDEMVAAR